MNLKAIFTLAALGTALYTTCWAAVPGTPQEQRTGAVAKVYFSHDLSAKGLQKVYARINKDITGRVAIKLHTGERNGPNILPRPWVQELQAKIPNSKLVETNTYYFPSDRYTTDAHRETLKINGWTFCPVDILDEEGTVMLPVKGGKHFTEMSMGSHILNYDSLLVLTHFKGHVLGGFGGSNKNIGIGCADGRIGKAMIHTGDNQTEWGQTEQQWQITKEPFMERMTESSKAIIDHFGNKIAYINVLRNMSVSCDCEGIYAAPVIAPDLGILASTDLLAVDQASIDMVYALHEKDHKDLVQRIESRAGLRQLSYMKELGMGNDKYILVDIEKEEAEAKAKAEAEAKAKAAVNQPITVKATVPTKPAAPAKAAAIARPVTAPTKTASTTSPVAAPQSQPSTTAIPSAK